jgi:hypothetical protein
MDCGVSLFPAENVANMAERTTDAHKFWSVCLNGRDHLGNLMIILKWILNK